MLALTMSGDTKSWEAALTDKPAVDRSDQFVGLATDALDRAYRLAGLILSDSAEAEDAVGDALERAWAGFAQLRDPAGFEAWFDRIVVNGCRDRLRRRQRVRFIPMEPGHDRPTSTDPFRQVVDRDDVLRRMRDLPDDERIVLVLHFWADLTLSDVATRTGWPIGTVKSRLHRALERMRNRPMAGADEELSS